MVNLIFELTELVTVASLQLCGKMDRFLNECYVRVNLIVVSTKYQVLNLLY